MKNQRVPPIANHVFPLGAIGQPELHLVQVADRIKSRFETEQLLTQLQIGEAQQSERFAPTDSFVIDQMVAVYDQLLAENVPA